MKLLLNLCLIAASAVPRGGVVAVDISGEDDALTMRVEAKGANARAVPQRGRFPDQRRSQRADRRPFHSALFHDASGPRVSSDAQCVDFARKRDADGRSSASDWRTPRLPNIPLTARLPCERAASAVVALDERSCANRYSLTGVSSAISGVASGCSPSPEPAPPNPYGDRSRRRRPRAGKALPSDGDSNPAGTASGVAMGAAKPTSRVTARP